MPDSDTKEPAKENARHSWVHIVLIPAVVLLGLWIFYKYFVKPSPQQTPGIVDASGPPGWKVTLTAHVNPVETPYGILTGNPTQDTPEIFRENDIVTVQSQSSGRYLCLVHEKDSIPSAWATVEFDHVVEATAKDPKTNKNAQWVVRRGIDPARYPGAVRLENVGVPGLYLKGFGDARIPGSSLPSAGWQPGAGQTDRSNLYSTIFRHIDPKSFNISTIVIYSSALGQNQKSIDRTSPIFLISKANGVITDPSAPATNAEMQWISDAIGVMTEHGAEYSGDSK